MLHALAFISSIRVGDSRFSCYTSKRIAAKRRCKMDKATFIETLHAERAEWEALLAEVGEARMLQPGVAGGWSVKDIIAHVMWGEREMVGVMQARALVGSKLWDLPEDERNAIMVAEQRDRPLHD